MTNIFAAMFCDFCEILCLSTNRLFLKKFTHNMLTNMFKQYKKRKIKFSQRIKNESFYLFSIKETIVFFAEKVSRSFFFLFPCFKQESSFYFSFAPVTTLFSSSLHLDLIPYKFSSEAWSIIWRRRRLHYEVNFKTNRSSSRAFFRLSKKKGQHMQ